MGHSQFVEDFLGQTMVACVFRRTQPPARFGQVEVVVHVGAEQQASRTNGRQRRWLGERHKMGAAQ